MLGAKRQDFIPDRKPPRFVVSRPVPVESNVGFYLVMLAMLFEFGRPQDLFPPLKAIPIPTLLDVSLAIAVFRSGKINFSNKQTKLWMGLLVVMALWVPFATNNYCRRTARPKSCSRLCTRCWRSMDCYTMAVESAAGWEMKTILEWK